MNSSHAGGVIWMNMLPLNPLTSHRRAERRQVETSGVVGKTLAVASAGVPAARFMAAIPAPSWFITIAGESGNGIEMFPPGTKIPPPLPPERGPPGGVMFRSW